MSAQTDRELLELAGKASGETYGPENNPLERDDLALRLAVACSLSVVRDGMEVMVRDYTGRYLDGPRWIKEDVRPDPYAATRRAIVRAAAATGQKGE